MTAEHVASAEEVEDLEEVEGVEDPDEEEIDEEEEENQLLISALQREKVEQLSVRFNFVCSFMIPLTNLFFYSINLFSASPKVRFKHGQVSFCSN